MKGKGATIILLCSKEPVEQQNIHKPRLHVQAGLDQIPMECALIVLYLSHTAYFWSLDFQPISDALKVCIN